MTRETVSYTIPEFLDVPIFPLPNITFFSQTYLPLHVFEDRYRAMVGNALGGDRLIGVALLREGWQRDYFGKPAICKTFGVGKIVDHNELSDGRYNMILEGQYRVRLVEEYPTEPFRTARVQVLLDPPIDGQRSHFTELMKDLQDLSERAGGLMPSLRETIQAAWSAHPHPLVTINHLASALVIDAYDRQSILEQDEPLRRARLLQVQMRTIVHQLERSQAHVEEVMEED
jgi:hypothetical protein